MTTEAFIIKTLDDNEDDRGYLVIDRTYKYGITLLHHDDVYGANTFKEFSLKDYVSENKDKTPKELTIEVNKRVDGGINDKIKKTKKDIIFTLKLTGGLKVKQVVSNEGEVIWENKDSFDSVYRELDNEWGIGWLGAIFEYYTGIITNSIKYFEDDYNDYVWGVYYPTYGVYF